MDTWDKKTLAMLVAGLVAVALLVSGVWLAADCDSIPAWCSPPEAFLFGKPSG